MDHRQQRTGLHRVVEVFGVTYGSGYAINDRMVLTARHLLVVDGKRIAPGQPVTVRVTGEENGRRATVEWVSKDVGDAALLSVEGAPWADAPDVGAVRWGCVADDGPVRCRAWGFPAAQARAQGNREVRDPEEMLGGVKALTASKRYEIDVRSAAPVLTDDEHSPWQGMSGAVLMDSRKRILGVVIANRLRYGGQRLQATPMERLFTDPEFCERAAADPSRLEAVGAEDAVQLDAPGERPILQTFHTAAPRLRGLSDYQLLQAKSQAVHFLGREDERQDLRAWCTADQAVSLGLVAGTGGAGKTRLGIQLCREFAERGWSTGFADEEVLDGALGANKAVDVVWPTLLILDYPDRLTDRTIKWIESMGARSFGPKLRILLLDRVPGGTDDRTEAARADLTWWANAKRITRSDFIARPQVVVHLRTGGLTGIDRSRHLESARRAFGGRSTDLSGLDLSDDAYRNPLKVHVAALLAIRGEFYPTAAEVMRHFLDREMDIWIRELNKHRIGNIAAPLAHQIVALTTLTRPKIDAVPQLLSAIPDLADPVDGGGLLRPNIRNWLTELFGVGSRISAIEPDLLAEELLGTTPDLDRIVVAIYRHKSSTAEHAASMLESLSLAGGGRESIRKALRRFLATCLGPLMAQAAAEPGGRLPGLIEIALTQFRDDGDALAELAVVAAGIRRVPHPQDSYRQVMSRLAQLALAWCDAQPPSVRTRLVRVDALTDMAAEAAITGSVAEATALAGEALGVCRSLGPDESRRLARAWYNLGTCQANSGDLPAAREALSTAAAGYRQRADEDTGELIERREALINLGSCLADLDDQAAALDACVEAIELHVGRDYTGHMLEPLAEPLALLARSVRGNPGPGASLGDPLPFRPLGWSEPEHRTWIPPHRFALITLVARLSTGLADSLAAHLRTLPGNEAPAKAVALSDALHRLTLDLSDFTLSERPLIESIELRRRFVTDDQSRAVFAKYLSTIAEDFGDADRSDAAIAYANESITEFQRLSPEHIAQYEDDFGKAVLTKVGALTQRGMMDPLQLTQAELQQSTTLELEEAELLLSRLPETPENSLVLASVSTMRGINLLLTGDTDAAGEALTRAGERYAAITDDSEDSFDERAIPYILLELLAGRRPYEWLTSLSDYELTEMDPEALPLLDQAILADSEEIGQFFDLLSGMLIAADRPDLALGFANQSVELARFWLRFEEESDPEERTEIRMGLSSSLSNLSGIRIGVPEEALRYAREAVDVIASAPEDELLLPLVRGQAELALARASLAGDPHIDVVGIAESATADLVTAVHSLGEIDELGSFADSASVAVMRAEALVILSNAYLAADRHAEAIEQALVARDLLLPWPQTKHVVTLMLSTYLVEGQGELAFGRYESALAALDQVIGVHEDADLAPSSPAALAQAVFLTAVCRQELGQAELAVQSSRLAMELLRSPELEQVPALQARVAPNLVVQAVGLGMLGDLNEAYRVSLEAVVAARGVPQAAAELVNALRVHANCAFELGRLPEALSVLEEGLNVAELAVGHKIPPIQLGLVNLGYGNCQVALSRHTEALDAFLAAAGFFREIPDQTPLFSGTLVLAARCHRELGRDLAGLPLLNEAVSRCCELIVDQHSAAGLADALTEALWEVVVCQESAGNSVDADAAATEGIDFLRTWRLSQPGEPTHATLYYADMLTSHFSFLAEHGRDLEALPFCVEATGILRNLGGIDPEAYLPAYLNSLASQGELLRRLGRPAEAAMADDEYARWAAD